jgi:hypothetical protein
MTIKELASKMNELIRKGYLDKQVLIHVQLLIGMSFPIGEIDL